MSEIGYATLSVIPSAKGFGKALSGQVNPQMASAGGLGGQAFGGGMLASAKKFAAPLAGLFAVGAIVDFFKDAASAAIEDEKSVVALSTAMDNLGMASKNAMAEDFVSGLQRATGEADSNLRPALQKLLVATGDLTQSQELLALAQNISAGTGRDLASVSQGLARASMGQFTALQRLGVPLDANIIKSKDFGAATKALTDTFGGQAAAAAQTYGGRLKILATAADEAKEAIGYALMESLDELTGGLDGAFADALEGAGDNVANFIRGLTVGAKSVQDFFAGLQAGDPGKDAEWMQTLNEWGNTLVQWLPGTPQNVAMLTGKVSELGKESADAAARGTWLTDELTRLREVAMGYAADLGYVNERTGEFSLAAGDAALALEELKAAQQALNDLLGAAEGRLAFGRWLRDLNGIVAGSTRSFDGWGKGVRKNQDALIEGFGLAETAVNRWVKEGKIGADEFDGAFAGKAAKIVRQFVDDGFELKDIRKFLKSQGLWTSELAALFNKGKNQSAYDEANRLGLGVGGSLGMGIGTGIAATSTKVQAMTRQLIREAEAAARAEAQSASPSKVWARIGSDLVDGLIQGLDSKKDKAKQAAEEMLSAIADKASGIVDKWDAKLEGLGDVLEKAQSDVESWASTMQQSLLSGFDIGAAYTAAIGADGKLSADKWIAGVDAQIAQMEWFGNVLAAIQVNGGANGQALMDYLAGKGAAVGGAMGQALIDKGLVQTMADKLALVTTNADTMAQAMVPPYLTAGVSQAQAMYDGFKANFGEGGPARVAMENLMDHIAASLGRTVTVSINTVYEAAGLPGRAAGGPVRAGHAYMVGERGPEPFIPGMDGTILPHGSLDMASAATRAAAVNGATGSPDMTALIGEVQALRKEVRDQAERDRTMARTNGYR